MAKIEFEIADDIELVDVEGYEGMKIPKDLFSDRENKARANGSNTFKTKLFDSIRESIDGDEIDISKTTARDLGGLIAAHIQKQTELAKNSALTPEQLEGFKQDEGKLRGHIEQEFKAKFDQELQKSQSEFQGKFALESEYTRIISVLGDIQPEFEDQLQSMIASTISMENGEGKVDYKLSGSTDYFYVEGKPATHKDVAELIKKKYPSAFKPVVISGAQTRTPGQNGGQGGGNEPVDWSKMTSRQIQAHMEATA